nr:hypothetical protein [Sphaerospermopsis sp. LEGE 08334]
MAKAICKASSEALGGRLLLMRNCWANSTSPVRDTRSLSVSP